MQPLPQHDHDYRSKHRNLAAQSETEWVRVGGTLRDTFGRRDTARTQRIRGEIRKSNALRRARARWETYEERWRALCVICASTNAPVGSVRFCDVPWPVRESLMDVDGLTTRAVGEFLFESLDVEVDRDNRGRTARKERIRATLVRWHPDKIALLLSRIIPEDTEMVKEGVYRVFYALRTLQDEERSDRV